ncbi:MAG: hypothetical protein IJU91_02720, partial [Selenomonadaceae bacterium]|nr:hypothetical protein [Selenomonadaceae bacterium]
MANQTHKTIIFEEFDDTNSDNLFTLLNDDPSGDELTSGLEKLTVQTFQEFMKKFAPKVYEVYRRNANGGIEFFYTTDPTKYAEYPYTEIDIGEHIYYQMLERLYESKGQSGKSNFKFDDSEIMEMLTPKKELDDVRNTRQKMEYNLKRYHEAKAKGDKSTMNACSKKLLECRQAIAKYSTSSLNKLLPILIEDNTKKLELLDAGSPADDKDGKKLPAPTFGQLVLNPDGTLGVDTNWKAKTVPAIAAPNDKKSEGALVEVKENLPAEVKIVKPQETKKIPDTQEVQNKIAATILKDYNENATNPNDTVRTLIVSTFAPLASQSGSEDKTQELDRNALMERRKNYENAYINSRQSFIREMSKIVESLLGVKTFFDHATAEGGAYSPIPGGVIISNCKASRLLQIKDKFAGYMKLLGKDQAAERIWFAVLPSVLENPPVDDTEIDDGDDDPLGGSINDSQSYAKKLHTDYVSKNALKEFDSCRYGHAVYAYPNFTLLNDRIKSVFDDRPDAQITLPGIYIDAAYPAAGLLVASQQHKVLDSCKLKYDKDSVCVGVDFENVAVKKAFQTKFNRESVLRRGEDLIKTINANMFGFAFSGDEVTDSGGTWKNSYIHCARSLAKNSKTGLYKPVYQTLIEDFIAQELNTLAVK